VRTPRLLVNRVRAEMVRRGDMMTIDDIIDILAIDLLGVVPDDEKIVISTNRGEPAVTDNKSLAGKAYREIARRLIGEDVPISGLDDEIGFVFKFKRLLGLKTN
jgi:septum site-determining protein MinD